MIQTIVPMMSPTNEHFCDLFMDYSKMTLYVVIEMCHEIPGEYSNGWPNKFVVLR